ncbi:MAG: PD-(D/E)XK nuclease family protein [Candidatus Omnitrophica bacterium]|nr:PD-(D/E)XK nuclease family protein [Candidatus Omnitrophota bacterium]
MKNGTSYTRKRNLFDPASKAPFRLSRSKLENFMQCPRCFYLDRRLGIPHPSMPAFTLNSAVDELLKKEFDAYRVQAKRHPLMERFGIDAIPFAHPMLKEWQENFKGVQHHHKETNFIITGAVDDLWQGVSGEIFVVDYKSTSTREPIDLNSQYKEAYKRQMEIYQWLLRRQELKVSKTGYFVYCNADKDQEMFNGQLIFDLEIIAYQGDDAWVEGVIKEAQKCLLSECIPGHSSNCEHCQYEKAIQEVSEERLTLPNKQEEFLF